MRAAATVWDTLNTMAQPKSSKRAKSTTAAPGGRKSVRSSVEDAVRHVIKTHEKVLKELEKR
jgi:hypothetical protein